MDDALQHMDAVLPGHGTVQLPIFAYRPGKRLPTRTPSTAHFLYLLFFAFLAAGDDGVLDRASAVIFSSNASPEAWRASTSRSIFQLLTLLNS